MDFTVIEMKYETEIEIKTCTIYSTACRVERFSGFCFPLAEASSGG